ncbi:hypothetical protein [Lichenifustis flavocetrariae]|uniref:DUF5666 domain-containing protein n=1 Tax=Lichenifustis flavocetrariae TaxID=2949735 RepID=A0AA41YQ50_9HYPH|nr:hypothetical protein [Lichenifustis flavocetrariae]MCW6506509.1 hypothetical protein [Lichenifustis flavocetrariae]
MRTSTFRLGAAFLCVGALTTAPAMAADMAHIRGTVSAVQGSHVTIKTVDGKDIGLTLGADWKIGGVVAASMADIKPGTFIGTANVAGPDGNKALEVVVFPEAMRGTGEGDYGWDLKPKSAMTNANVTSKVDGVDGSSVMLSYKGGEKKVTISPSTPIVTIVPATEDDVKTGAKVFVAGSETPDGTMLSGGRLVVGKNGVTPPM